MRYIRVNRFCRPEIWPKPRSPDFMIDLREDGALCGDISLRNGGCIPLPDDLTIPEHQRLFEIPAELAGRRVASHQDHEIMISISGPLGRPDRGASFLMSEVPPGSTMHAALAELLQIITKIGLEGKTGP
jgi:hypothetical protein